MVSDQTKASLTTQDCDEVFISLLRLSHPVWDADFFLCNNNVDVDDGSQIWTAWPFILPLANERTGEVPKNVLTLGNIDTTVSAAIKKTAGSRSRIQVYHSLVTASRPNVIDRGPIHWVVRNIQCNLRRVIAQLVLSTYDETEIPVKKMDPGNFPGLFGSIK